MKRESFVLYTKINEIVKKLTDAQKGKLFQAILDYQETGEVAEMETIVEVVFLPIKHDMDANAKKYDEVKKARSLAGKKGMEKRWKKDNKAITNDNTVITGDNKNNYNDNDNDNVTVKPTKKGLTVTEQKEAEKAKEEVLKKIRR